MNFFTCLPFALLGNRSGLLVVFYYHVLLQICLMLPKVGSPILFPLVLVCGFKIMMHLWIFRSCKMLREYANFKLGHTVFLNPA